MKNSGFQIVAGLTRPLNSFILPTEMINWDSMSETSLLPSPAETLASFCDFATAFRALLSHHDWNDDDVISVLEELAGKLSFSAGN